MTQVEHTRMANAIRGLAMDAVEQAKSGHPGLPMGAADVATVLFTRFLKFDPADPAWPDRDRFVLSAGHGSMLIYALLHLLGYEAMTIEQIKRFRQIGSLTPGHPENFITPGVETTTGPLGQGLANAVGMATAEAHLAATFGKDVVDHRTYVLASDGDLMEGISHEAIALAGHLKLNKLIVLFDDNGISIDGPLSLADSVDQVKRFEAAGWKASRIDGHDPEAIAAALAAAQTSDRPVMIACRTTIGFGAPTKAGKASSHGSPLGAEEIAGARKALGWSEAPFEVPADARDLWRAAGKRDRLVADPFHQVAVGAEHVGAVVHDPVAEAGVEDALGERHSDGVGEPLAERAGGGLDPGCMPVLGMAGRARAKLAEALDLLDGHLRIAEEIKQCIKQHRAVAGGEHEAVAIRPSRIGRVEF